MTRCAAKQSRWIRIRGFEFVFEKTIRFGRLTIYATGERVSFDVTGALNSDSERERGFLHPGNSARATIVKNMSK